MGSHMIYLYGAVATSGDTNGGYEFGVLTDDVALSYSVHCLPFEWIDVHRSSFIVLFTVF